MTQCSECKAVGGSHTLSCKIGFTPPRRVVQAVPDAQAVTENDPVNHPSHYQAYKGLEVIDLTEQLNFNRGNAVKYICRAGIKHPAKEIEDLEKAAWYINREIERMRSDLPVRRNA